MFGIVNGTLNGTVNGRGTSVKVGEVYLWGPVGGALDGRVILACFTND